MFSRKRLVILGGKKSQPDRTHRLDANAPASGSQSSPVEVPGDNGDKGAPGLESPDNPIATAPDDKNPHTGLNKLPAELIVEIARDLIFEDLESLRQTSRLMWRYLSSPRLRRLINPEGRRAQSCTEPITLITPITPITLDQPRHLHMRLRLKQDHTYCEACHLANPDPRTAHYPTQLYLNPSMKRLYCGGCKRNHFQALFSAPQRAKKIGFTRRCVAYEGHLRVCEHAVLRWAKLRRLIRRCTRKWRSSHCLEARVTATLCKHPSHRLQCPEGHPSRCSSRGIKLLVSQRHRGAPVSVDIYSKTYVLLPPRDNAAWIDPEVLLREALRPSYEANGRFLMREPNGDLPCRMAAFDNCSCLANADAEPDQKPFTAKHEVRLLSFDNFSEPDDTITSKFSVRPFRCTRSRGPLFYPDVAAQASGLEVEQHMVLTAHHYPPRWSWEQPRVPRSWFAAMDVDSYSLVVDGETRRLGWCDDAGCANYVKRPGVYRLQTAAADIRW